MEYNTSFDGDKVSFIGIFLEESVAECKRVLSSKNFHIRTDGSIAHSLATDTVKYLLKGMLRNVATVAKESDGNKSEAPLYMDVSEGMPIHLLEATHSKTQGGLLASTQTTMLKPGMGNVHLTTEINGVLVAVEADATK